MAVNEKKSRGGSWLWWVIALVVVVLLFWWMSSGGSPGTYVTLTGGTGTDTNTSVETLIDTGKVTDVYVSNGTGYIKVLGSTVTSFPTNADYYFTYSSTAELQTVLGWVNGYNAGDNNGGVVPAQLISYSSSTPGEDWLSALLPWLGIIIMVVVVWFLFRGILGANSKTMGFGKTKARPAENVKVKFTDVAGIDEEKEQLEEIVEFLKNPSKFTDLGAKIPKGILLVGLPGTGKTLLAKAIAGESNVPFFSISGSDFVEMFVGVGASRVRDLFEQAKRNAPCIVFIDEIDAVGRQRGAGLGGGNDEREQTLNQLLVQMDGFEGNEGIIVMAATNRADILDPALLRPGRFDRQLYVYPPDVKGREMIFKVHARNKPLAEDVNFKDLARLTSGFTGADIENILNEAAIITAKANRKRITMTDIREGIMKVVMGPQKKSRIITDEDKKITAYHESGHAIIGKSVKESEKIHEVSIIPRGAAGGYTLSLPEKDEVYTSRDKLIDEITLMYGGRVAEELTFGKIYSGAQNDIQRATQMARKMVTEYGMSSLGPISYHNETEIFVGKNYQTQVAYSESKAAEIDEEIRKILMQCYNEATRILKAHSKELKVMAEVLTEKETIYSEEVDLIMAGKGKDEVIAIMEENEKKNKAKAEVEKAQTEFERAQKEQAVRIKTAEALKNAGVIDETEITKIKIEADGIVKQAKKKYDEVSVKQAEVQKEKLEAGEELKEAEKEVKTADKALKKAEKADKAEGTKAAVKKAVTAKKKTADKDADKGEKQ